MRSLAKPSVDTKKADERTLRILRNTPLVSKAEEEFWAERDLERARHAAAIQSVLHQRLEDMRAFDEEGRSADAELRRAEEALASARRKDSEVRTRKYQAQLAFDLQEAAHRRALQSTYHEEIDAFFDEMRALRQNLQNKPWSQSRSGELDAWSLKRERQITTNTASVERLVLAIVAACDAAESMKLDVRQSDVPERLKALRDSLPEVVDETIILKKAEKAPTDEGKEKSDRGRKRRGLRDALVGWS